MSNVINLDSRRKVPSEFQQRAMIRRFVIEDVHKTYMCLPKKWVDMACWKAVCAVDEGAGFDEAVTVAGRYLNRTMEENKHIVDALAYAEAKADK